MKSRKKLHKGKTHTPFCEGHQSTINNPSLGPLGRTVQQPTDIKLHIRPPFYNIKGCNSAMLSFLFYGELFIIYMAAIQTLMEERFIFSHCLLLRLIILQCNVLWEFQRDCIWSLGQKDLLDRTWKFRPSGSHGDHVLYLERDDDSRKNSMVP